LPSRAKIWHATLATRAATLNSTAEHFLDTNVIIRLIAADDARHTKRAREFFKRVERGDVTVTFPEVVLVEAVAVLSSKALYRLPRDQVAHALTGLLRLPGVRLPLKHTYIRALEVYASRNVDFADAIIFAFMERSGVTTVVTFDRDFRRFPGITSVEP
jgi:predicted nucleic acid-binding protein